MGDEGAEAVIGLQSGGGDGKAARRAAELVAPDLLGNQLAVCADGGMTDIQPFRRPSDTPLLNQGQECVNLGEANHRSWGAVDIVGHQSSPTILSQRVPDKM